MKHIWKFLRSCEFYNVPGENLCSIAPKRTLYFFDALLKFLAYCDVKIDGLQPDLIKMKEMHMRRNELLSKIEVLRTEINRRAVARTQRQDKIREVNFLNISTHSIKIPRISIAILILKAIIQTRTHHDGLRNIFNLEFST